MSEAEFYNVLSGYITIAVTILGIYLGHKARFSAFFEKQLKEVYSPIFIKLEPYLYKEITLKQALLYAKFLYKIINKHHLLCDPKLVYYVELFCNAVKNGKDFQYAYMEICSHVDRKYDKLRRQLRLPVRPLWYRLNKDQYKTKQRLIVALVMYILLNLLLVAMLLIGILALLGAVLMVLDPILKQLTMP